MENSIIGRWVSVDHPCFAYNFLYGGNGFYSMWDGKKDFTYTDNASSVTIHFINDMFPSTFEYRVIDDVLLITDSFGTVVKYLKHKEQ